MGGTLPVAILLGAFAGAAHGLVNPSSSTMLLHASPPGFRSLVFSIKQSQLIMGVLPLAEVTVHYIDVRAVGKGYDEFFEEAKAMGASFVKGRVAGSRRPKRGT